MNRVRITGWRPGLLKITLTKIIPARLRCTLAEAKLCTGRVLEAEEVILHVPDVEITRMLVQELEATGATVTPEYDVPASRSSISAL